MKTPLPPGLVPQPSPPTRANSIARVREMLDDLARPGHADHFLLASIDPQQMVHAVGSVTAPDMMHMAANLLRLAYENSPPGTTTHARAGAALDAMGAIQVASYGGARPTEDGT